jgi:hypothetical protein
VPALPSLCHPRLPDGSACARAPFLELPRCPAIGLEPVHRCFLPLSARWVAPRLLSLLCDSEIGRGDAAVTRACLSPAPRAAG